MTTMEDPTKGDDKRWIDNTEQKTYMQHSNNYKAKPPGKDKKGTG